MFAVLQITVFTSMAKQVGIYSRGVPNAPVPEDALSDDEEHSMENDGTRHEENILQLDHGDDASDIEMQRDILRGMSVYIGEKSHETALLLKKLRILLMILTWEMFYAIL